MAVGQMEFGFGATPAGGVSGRGVARDGRRAGLRHAEVSGLRAGVGGCLYRALRSAGPARDGVGSVVRGGLTLHEARAAVEGLRGRATAITSVTQPLKDLRAAGLVRDSGRVRKGPAGKANTVWEVRHG